MAERDEIVAYANELLEIERFPEFAPQGLQVVGAPEVTTIACGVSCSRELFERAVELGAELVLVHHGLFWRNEPLVVDARFRGRLEALFRGDASLLAYHLALDAHPTLGNNAQLAARVGATPVGPFEVVGLGCTIDAVRVEDLAARVAGAVGRTPLVLRGDDREIRRLAVSTGAAGHDLLPAAHEGYDALLTGSRRSRARRRRGSSGSTCLQRGTTRASSSASRRSRRTSPTASSSSGTSSRSPTPSDPVAVRPHRRVSSGHMDVFGRRAR